MLCAVLCRQHLTCSNPLTPPNNLSRKCHLIPISQMKKLRVRAVKKRTRVHSANRRQGQQGTPGCGPSPLRHGRASVLGGSVRDPGGGPGVSQGHKGPEAHIPPISWAGVGCGRRERSDGKASDAAPRTGGQCGVTSPGPWRYLGANVPTPGPGAPCRPAHGAIPASTQLPPGTTARSLTTNPSAEHPLSKSHPEGLQQANGFLPH